MKNIALLIKVYGYRAYFTCFDSFETTSEFTYIGNLALANLVMDLLGGVKSLMYAKPARKHVRTDKHGILCLKYRHESSIESKVSIGTSFTAHHLFLNLCYGNGNVFNPYRKTIRNSFNRFQRCLLSEISS